MTKKYTNYTHSSLQTQELPRKRGQKIQKRSKRLIALHLLWPELRKEFTALTHKKFEINFEVSVINNFLQKEKYFHQNSKKIKFECEIS